MGRTCKHSPLQSKGFEAIQSTNPRNNPLYHFPNKNFHNCAFFCTCKCNTLNCQGCRLCSWRCVRGAGMQTDLPK